MSKKTKKGERNKPVRNVLVTVIALILLALSGFSIACFFELDGAVQLADRAAELLGLNQNESTAVQPAVSDSTVQPVEEPWTGWQNGRVVADAADLLAVNGAGKRVRSTLNKGDKVIIIGQNNGRYNVRAGGIIGWVQCECVSPEGERTEFDTNNVQDEPEITDLVDTEHKRALDAKAGSFGCAGVSAAVIKNGEVAYTYEYGYADIKSRTKMTADTKIRVASITKVLVAMTALSMRDMELVDLDAPIGDYLDDTVYNPSYPDTPITLRHLLTHTSSFTDFGVNGNEKESLYKKLYSSEYYMKVRPGTAGAWKYNNSGLCAAGAVLEHAGGTTLVDYTKGYFFEPLGVDASLWAGDIKDQELIATLYDGSHSVRQTALQQTTRPYYETPGDNFCLYAGDLTISAQDLARLVCVLINDGTYHDTFYLYPESVEELESVHYELEYHQQCLTLCSREDQVDSRKLYYHNGNAYGVLSYMSYDPETGDGVVVITTGSNSDKKSHDSYMVCRTFAEYFYGTVLKAAPND